MCYVFCAQSMLKEDEFFKEIATSFPNASMKDDDSNVWGHSRTKFDPHFSTPSAAALIGSDCASSSTNTSTSLSPCECQTHQSEPLLSHFIAFSVRFLLKQQCIWKMFIMMSPKDKWKDVAPFFLTLLLDIVVFHGQIWDEKQSYCSLPVIGDMDSFSSAILNLKVVCLSSFTGNSTMTLSVKIKDIFYLKMFYTANNEANALNLVLSNKRSRCSFRYTWQCCSCFIKPVPFVDNAYALMHLHAKLCTMCFKFNL